LAPHSFAAKAVAKLIAPNPQMAILDPLSTFAMFTAFPKPVATQHPIK
jgi:hypothetical protein